MQLVRVVQFLPDFAIDFIERIAGEFCGQAGMNEEVAVDPDYRVVGAQPLSINPVGGERRPVFEKSQQMLRVPLVAGFLLQFGDALSISLSDCVPVLSVILVPQFFRISIAENAYSPGAT